MGMITWLMKTTFKEGTRGLGTVAKGSVASQTVSSRTDGRLQSQWLQHSSHGWVRRVVLSSMGEVNQSPDRAGAIGSGSMLMSGWRESKEKGHGRQGQPLLVWKGWLPGASRTGPTGRKQQLS